MPAQPSKPDLSFLRVGARAVLRSRLTDPAPGGPSLTDTVGEVVALTEETAELRTRTGVVAVHLASVVAAREAPPAPPARGRRHLAISIVDLQRVMVEAVPPLETAHLGSWLLRAAAGYTGRANSALPLGDPGLPLPEALDAVTDWYSARGLSAMLQLALPPSKMANFSTQTTTDGQLLDPNRNRAVTDGQLLGHQWEWLATDPIGRAALERGWQAVTPTLVMTASARTVAAAARATAASAGAVRVTDSETETDDWWAVSGARTLRNRQTASLIHRRITHGRYPVAYADDQPAGHVRLALSDGWSGICDLHVAPGFRGRGIGRELVVAAAAQTQAHGIRNLYLQVAQENSAAISLYRALGFDVHHEYVYLTRA